MKNGNGKRAKTTAKTTGMLIPQAHGGALRNGGTNAGGPGRPPSIIRARCRGSFESRIGVLEAIADGEASERIEVPLFVVLEYAECPKCNGKLKVKDDAPGAVVIEGKTTPRAKDRTQAVDVLGKYGMNAGRVDQEEVRTRLARTVQKITELTEPSTAQELLTALDRIWDPNQDEHAA